MRPLDGIRVLDLTHVFAGPFCTYQLAVLGADVIKIEPPGRPDMTRFTGAVDDLNHDGMGLGFQGQGGGKRALALDLKSTEGKAVFHRLVDGADVVVQNYTSHCLAELGLDADTLTGINPRLVYCSISGFGRSGPKANDPAYDVVIQAFAGVMAANGEADSPPVRIGPPVVDFGTGAQAALAITAALLGREKTGRGRVIDVAMADCALMLMLANTVATEATGVPTRPHGNHDPNLPCYSAYETAEGTIMLGAFTPAQAADLMAALGNDAATEMLRITPMADLHERAEGDRAFLTETLKARTASEWEEHLNAHHVPAARVRRLDEALAHPQIAGRLVMQDVPGNGPGPARLPVAGYSYDEGSPRLDAAPARHGAHSCEVLAEAGYGEAEIDRLLTEGVVAAAS
ncbi:CaiB/BaiF CoA-transferase family protein [Alisedimentitalea sp. MJ-SS2]|uniref:CaiB/BaiF CoA transferase family protein n=1 Tax=Aliisedimentitalea sp. MJ-SS2 TaxID=3049795 RepID=UPI00290AA6FE|nr:CaiB/BaiF CoA-transferase family protein [Alisedimentitalea sp. MJ-SS2]MDU8927804.1 CaiB/BaiF CoA-transferase family protein [Alisedimentitalea sp. MJ-SS2]